MRTIASVACVFAVACVQELPPAATPDRVVPTIATVTTPAEGQGRLVIDVVDGPTAIDRIQMEPHPIKDEAGRESFQFWESTSRLCETTPCVVDLTPGNILLAFPIVGRDNAVETELVHVGADPSVYRRALSHYDPPGGTYVLGIVGTAIGGMTLIPGLVFLPLGLAKGNDGFTIAGAITLGVGSVLTAVSILGIVADPPSRQAGASVHYPLAPDPTPRSQ